MIEERTHVLLTQWFFLRFNLHFLMFFCFFQKSKENMSVQTQGYNQNVHLFSRFTSRQKMWMHSCLLSGKNSRVVGYDISTQHVVFLEVFPLFMVCREKEQNYLKDRLPLIRRRDEGSSSSLSWGISAFDRNLNEKTEEVSAVDTKTWSKADVCTSELLDFHGETWKHLHVMRGVREFWCFWRLSYIGI